MKHTILEALRTRYAGVAEPILDRIADKLAETVTDEADVATAVDGAWKDVLQAYGDKRATDATKTAVANYERKHNLKDGKAIEEQPKEGLTTTPTGDGQPDKSDTLLAEIKKLTDRLDRMDGERTQQSRNSIIDTLIEPLPPSIRKAYQRQQFAAMSEDEFANLQEEIKAEVNEIQAEVTAKGAVFSKPATVGKQQTDTGKATDKEADEVVKMMHL